MTIPSATLLSLLLAGTEPRLRLHPSSPRFGRRRVHRRASSSADAGGTPASRWRRRTSKRREPTEELLDRIESSAAGTLPPVPTLVCPPIDWDLADDGLDPVRGGRLRPDAPRGARKRAQVEAFVPTTPWNWRTPGMRPSSFVLAARPNR